MEGLAGAGLFPTGNMLSPSEYGGWLPEFLEPEVVLDYIEQADGILQHFRAPADRFMPGRAEEKCLAFDLHMSQAQLKHLGTSTPTDHAKNGAVFERASPFSPIRT